MLSSNYLLETPKRFTQDWKTILGLTLLLLALYLPGLGGYGPFGPWDTPCGAVARYRAHLHQVFLPVKHNRDFAHRILLRA